MTGVPASAEECTFSGPVRYHGTDSHSSVEDLRPAMSALFLDTSVCVCGRTGRRWWAAVNAWIDRRARLHCQRRHDGQSLTHSL